MILPPLNLLAPFGAFYGAVTRARLALYRMGALATRKVEVPVISVGNITTGGTGKTPLVAWIARAVALEGRRVCVLTRGYGRANPRERVLVSDGERIRAGASEGGDEPRLLAEMLQGVAAVVSDADRFAAARWSLQNLGSEVFILDDGFQHMRLARDLDILTVDATDPWGGKQLLPRGRLREPLSELKRADCIVITRANQASGANALRAEIERRSKVRTVILSRARTSNIRLLYSTAENARDEKPPHIEAASLVQPVAAFCAIGNPQTFFKHLCDDGHDLIYTRAFRDHHLYTQGDITSLCREAKAQGAQLLLTTAKDAVKLGSFGFEIACYVVEIDLEFDDEQSLLDMIHQTVSRNKKSS